MRRPTLLFVAIASSVGLGLFQLKYQVMTLEKDYQRIRKSIRETDEAIHVLKAEWAHLNDPKRLQLLCERYLTVAPIRGSQLISFRQIIEGEAGGNVAYDRGAMDKLVADLVSDTTLTALNE
ncbi:MAG: hypothetical protein FJX71_04310 [Alphaproteobacteria bacterium]|nr:hypothetical protein [Alphaproteobacteria bacterium]